MSAVPPTIPGDIQVSDMSITSDLVVTNDVTMLGDTIVGDQATDKVGFFGKTPVVQPAGTGNANYVDSGATIVHADGTFNGGSGTAYTIGDIVVALKALGLLAQ